MNNILYLFSFIVAFSMFVQTHMLLTIIFIIYLCVFYNLIVYIKEKEAFWKEYNDRRMLLDVRLAIYAAKE